MFTTIWERYFLKKFLKIFLLFLFCFYGLYILIDFASHTSALPHHTLQLKFNELFRYYTYIFASRAEILIPVALLIAFIKTVTSLNANNELVALMASGFKLKTLMRPFLWMGCFCTALLLLNEQFLLPTALKKLRRIEDLTKHQRSREGQMIAVKQIILEDGSLFLFQKYDSILEQFFDAYWIPSTDIIYRIKNLAHSGEHPVGYFVDHLIRQENGELIQVASYKELVLNEMRFNQKILQSAIVDPEVLSLTELAIRYKQVTSELNEKESKLLTAFYWKLTIPWLCLLAILIPAPLCVKFSRQSPVFLTYVICLFALLSFYMFIDATQVIAKRQVVSPLFAIIAPFLLVSLVSVFRYARLR